VLALSFRTVVPKAMNVLTAKQAGFDKHLVSPWISISYGSG
jgi:hypothetical protein